MRIQHLGTGVASLLAAWLAASAAALDCEKRPACSDYWRAEAVFVATCVRHEFDEDAILDVHEVLRGCPPMRLRATSLTGFSTGFVYVVFARRLSPRPGEALERWSVIPCGATAPLLAISCADLDYVYRVARSPGEGQVQVNVEVRDSAVKGRTGASSRTARRGLKVVIASADRAFTATTDAWGHAQVTAPSGHYWVIVLPPAGHRAPDPKFVEVGHGACHDLGFAVHREATR